jgi:hypothetical protein
MRLCRACSTLRRWDGRHKAAGVGLKARASRCGGEGGNARLASYREQASSISSPADATPPVMVCADIAGDAAEHTEYPGSPKEAFPQMLSNEIDKGTECAIQLMRLGAEPNRTLHVGNGPDTDGYRRADFDGKTALEQARMSKRRELVELMEQHLRYTPEESAEVVTAP